MTASCVESWLHATSGEPSWHLQLPPLDSRRTPPYLTFAKRFAHGAGAEGLVEIIQAGVVGNVIELLVRLTGHSASSHSLIP